MPLMQRLESNCDFISLHKAQPHRYPFLLESALVSKTGQNFDILFAFPQQTLVLDGQGLIYKKSAVPPLDYHSPNYQKKLDQVDFITEFDQWWQSQKKPHANKSELPFSGGWFVYFSYEFAEQIEPSLRLPRSIDCLPTAFATRVPAAIIKNHKKNTVFAVAEDGRQDLIEQIKTDISALPIDSTNFTPSVSISRQQEETPQRYLNSVARIKRYIKNGDVFQVNLSRLWTVNVDPGCDYMDLYRQLRQHNPSPFFGLVLYGDAVLLSSSPERLVKVVNQQIETRPIAGTRPRSAHKTSDILFQDELMSNPKERAEHIMLIDLERNDLGRVCIPGSIEVNELMVLESYAHVHHIVSNIRGKLRTDITPGDVIAAVFPGGTITGCPKVRGMEIIAELENQGRGAYTGSMGYINLDGSMDLNILIRTMVKCGNQIQLRAGAGIVADSIAEHELKETKAKAKGLLASLGLTSN